MDRRQINQAQSFIRADEFTETLLADFTHQPPTPVDLKFATAQARLATAIADLGGKQAIQAGGDFSEETAKQRQLRADLKEELSDINTTADAIAAETANPALMERFRMPDSNGDVPLVATARAFAKAIRELSLNDEFAAHGHPPDTATDLETMATEFEGSEGKQGTALGERAGATASIPAAIRAGTAAIKTLDAIINRIYKGNPATLTAWDTASHVQRSPRRRPEDDTTPAPPTP